MKISDLTVVEGSLEGLVLPEVGTVKPLVNGHLVALGPGTIGIANAGAWTEIGVVNGLFRFDPFRFSTPLSGRLPPTAAQVLEIPRYAAAPWASNPDFFNVVNGIQKFTVPESGLYVISAVGAHEAAVTYNGVRTAQVVVTASFLLNKGDVLNILCGQRPSGSGGSGASFVESAEKGLLLIGAGTGYAGGYENSRIDCYPSLNISNPGTGLGGTSAGSASSGSNTGVGQGGAGWLGDGSGSTKVPRALGLEHAERAYGGTGFPTVSTTGGFGGGGSSGSSAYRWSVGGGGGYTGGAGASQTRTHEGNRFRALSSKAGTHYVSPLTLGASSAYISTNGTGAGYVELSFAPDA